MQVFTPYRMCPLGAHVDHQHGIVTGFAIDKGVKGIIEGSLPIGGIIIFCGSYSNLS